jgi:hypothetical protein
MRDFAEVTRLEQREEPRGRAALGLSPKGMFYDWVVRPMGGRGWTLAAKATQIALTLFTGVTLVAAVWALTH